MGIKISAKVKIKHNYKKIQKISSSLAKNLPDITKEVMNNIRGYAIRLEKGHNEEGILVELVDTETNRVEGRVYTDKIAMPYAMFEHFGTGRYAEMEHIGTSKHFIESGFTEWFIPANKVQRPLQYPIVTINDMQFYVAHGAKANHFMTDAEFQSRKENIEIAKNKIHEILKEACK